MLKKKSIQAIKHIKTITKRYRDFFKFVHTILSTRQVPRIKLYGQEIFSVTSFNQQTVFADTFFNL